MYIVVYGKSLFIWVTELKTERLQVLFESRSSLFERKVSCYGQAPPLQLFSGLLKHDVQVTDFETP